MNKSRSESTGFFRFGTNAFLADFYSAGDRHPRSENALMHYRRAFVEPRHLPELIEAIRPHDQRKVVVIDGHPRSGKTWAVLAACSLLATELDLHPGQWWTSGLDSLKVFPYEHSTLADAAEQVREAISKRPSGKLFLLDDFLGTNTPREMLRIKDPASFSRYLSWDADNPWLQVLPEGSSLIMTGRALFFTLADMLFNVTTRPPRAATTQHRSTPTVSIRAFDTEIIDAERL